VRDFPPKREFTEQGELLRGLGVRVQVLRDNASCELQLDDRALFYPSDAALASWMAQAHDRQATIVFDDPR
jgi:DNA polymerase III subunit alpha